MSSRTKFPPKPKKTKASSKKSLETADDFQEAADAEEETGGKWRAGDKAKSCRAFLRAIEIYSLGLQRYPRNFDLAYNKARLQFDVSQQSGLVTKLPVSLSEFLEATLQSHKYALSLNEENTDILFNTAQIQIALAENILEESDPQELDQQVPLGLLRQSLELLDGCFSRQNMLFEEQREAWDGAAEDTDEGGGVALDDAPTPSSSSPTAQSATIESSIVPSDLLDTVLTSLTALTQLISISDSSSLAALSELASGLLATKLPYCISLLSEEEQSSSVSDIALSRVSFVAAQADAAFEAGQIDAETYLVRLASLPNELDLSDPEHGCTLADILVEAASSLLGRLKTSSSPSETDTGKISELLQRAGDIYTTALSILDKRLNGGGAAKGGLELSIGARQDPELLSRIASIHESVGDLNLLGANLVRLKGQDATAVTGMLRTAAGEYALAGKGSITAEDMAAAKKVEVRRRVSEVLASVSSGVSISKVSGEAVTRLRADQALSRRVIRQMAEEELVWEWPDEVLECGINVRR